MVRLTVSVPRPHVVSQHTAVSAQVGTSVVVVVPLRRLERDVARRRRHGWWSPAGGRVQLQVAASS